MVSLMARQVEAEAEAEAGAGAKAELGGGSDSPAIGIGIGRMLFEWAVVLADFLEHKPVVPADFDSVRWEEAAAPSCGGKHL